MKRRISATLFVLFLAALLVSSLLIPSLAAPGKTNLGTLTKVAASAIKVDGTKDAAYADGIHLTIKAAKDTSMYTEVWFLWTDGYLYMYGEIHDKDLTDLTADKKKTSPWTADSIECFIDDDNDGKDYGMQYRVDFTGYGTWKDRNANKNYYTKDVLGTDFQYGATKTAFGYTGEMRMPLKAVKGNQVGINVQVNGISETYANTSTGWVTAEYAYFVLGDVKATAAATTKAAAATTAKAAATAAAPKTADVSVIIASVMLTAAAACVVIKKKH